MIIMKKSNSKNKKILSVITSILLLEILFCSCNFDVNLASSNSSSAKNSDVNSSSQDSDVSSSSPEINNYTSTSYGYDNLSSTELKDLYFLIAEYAEKADSDDISTNATFDIKQLNEVISAYKNDHPEVFWLRSEFKYGEDENGYTIVSLEYLLSGSDLVTARQKFDDTLNQALSGAPQGASDFELEVYANDYLVSNCVYDKEAAKTGDIIANENDAYGALVDKKAVCEGYARAFQLLCNNLGIDCINVFGNGESEPHQWNCVKLEDEWYEVDVTWNDSDDEDGLTTYDYLNITSNEISVNHSKVPLYKDVSLEEYEGMNRELNLFVPECNGQKYNYYKQNCATLTDINNADDIVNEIAKAADANEESASFLLDNSFNYDDTYDKLLNEGYISEWIDKANQVNSNNPQLDAQCYVYKSEVQKIITIELKYL